MVNSFSMLIKAVAFLLWNAYPAAAIAAFSGAFALDLVAFRPGDRKGTRALMRALPNTLGLNLASFIAGAGALEMAARATITWKEGLPWAARVSAWLIQATGLPATEFNGAVHLTTMAGPLRFAASWDALGLPVLLVVLALAIVATMYRAPDWNTTLRVLLRVVLTLWVVALLRFTLSILLFNSLCYFTSHETEALPVTLFIRPLAIAALFLPFVPALLRALIPPPIAASSNTTGTRRLWPRRHTLLRAVPAWLLLTALLLFVGWEPRGTSKHGHVLFDGYSAQWSPTDRPYDRNWYGADSGYNYACMRRWLDKFYTTEVLDGPIREGVLDNASVLIVYLPDRSYSQDEIRRIEAFVRRGGGLLLIGDHTNVFGSTSHLNDLCARMGMQIRYDVLFGLDTHFFQMFEPPRFAPSLLYGMPFMKLRGAVSIRPTSLSTHPFMTVGNAKALPAIYSVGNFYPPPHDDPRMTFGHYAIATAARAGSGRVVAFGDSTIFSNFEIFYPGKYELVLNMTHWLNHRDPAWLGASKRIAALAAFLIALALAWHARRPPAVLATTIAVVAIFGLSRNLTHRAESAMGTFPPPRQPLQSVFFVAEPDDPAYVLRDFTSRIPFDQRYNVFIQWILRANAFPGFRIVPADSGNELYTHLKNSPKADTAAALILRNEEQVAHLAKIEQDAGIKRVMLLFSESFTRECVETALIESGLADCPESLDPAWAGWPGGNALLDVKGRRLLLVFDAERFSDRNMGITEKAYPDTALRARFDQAYDLTDLLFAGDVPAKPRQQTYTPENPME